MIGLVDGNNFFVSCERVIDPRLEGKPVAVLSNNDGCCVSRSNEFKALGIPMGTPYFQLKTREASGELIFRSSNYELYGDISRRIISVLRDETLGVEQYSIDEAFIYPPDTDLMEFGKNLRAMILKWTGIPCGVGFAPTKTLAKIANHIAKKRPEGVFVLPEDPTDILRGLPVEEVWGIGRRMGERLRMHGIVTADQLRSIPDEMIRSIGSIVTVRTAMELRGQSAVDDRAYDADPDSVSCSRSFGEPVTSLEGLSESVASFASQGAEKLRKHGLVAAGCNIYAQYGSALESNWTERTAVFDLPTSATNDILKAIRAVVGGLFLQGAKYRKSGIVFFGLEKAGAARQMDLFDAPRTDGKTSKKLYEAVDALNKRFGRGRVFSAAEGIKKPWQMKRSLLSRRATTKWSELLVVR